VKYELGFYIPEDGILHSDRSDNLKSYTVSSCLSADDPSWFPQLRSDSWKSECLGQLGERLGGRTNSVSASTGKLAISYESVGFKFFPMFERSKTLFRKSHAISYIL
jgi:hypothetical protein